MIPLKDNVRTSSIPAVTVLLIIINVLVFLLSLGLGRRMDVLVLTYGVVPVRYTAPEIAAHFTALEQALPFLTFQFLHAGWLHLISNMWFLWIFGDNVEDRLGHVRYLLFYLLCGAASGLAHIATNPDSQLGTIGASGAIAGVMGAYFLFYPRAKVVTLIPLFIFVEIVEVPAFFFLGVWALIQFLSGTLAEGSGQMGGVAWWAHIGGFVTGMLLGALLGRRRRVPTTPSW